VTDGTHLDSEQLAAYFALMEVGSLLHHAVEQQLRAEGDLSYVQFQILAGLNRAPGGQQRMTDIADRVVYSRSGLTYQAAQLDKAGLITRAPSLDDERSTTVTITPAGRARLGRVMPGHVEVVRHMLFASLDQQDVVDLTSTLVRVRDRIRTQPPRSAAPRARRKPTSADVTAASKRSSRGEAVEPG
jgi:DNA-binding MarR family transcriptional regulator